MPNYDNIRKKAKDAFDTLADVSVEAYKLAEEKARILARRTKLSAEIAREKVLIRRLKAEIGQIYYDLHKDDPEEACKKHCDDVTASLDSIAAKRRELEELKAGPACCCDETEKCDCEPEPEAATEDCECKCEPEPEAKVAIEVEVVVEAAPEPPPAPAAPAPAPEPPPAPSYEENYRG